MCVMINDFNGGYFLKSFLVRYVVSVDRYCKYLG